jgi:hypothetical protein
MLCTNQAEIPEDVIGITDTFRLMTRDAELAAKRNSTPERKAYEQPSLVS